MDPSGNMLLSTRYIPGFAMDTWNAQIGQVIVYEFAPDPRDPGNKGHAVAQLRERTGDPALCVTYDRDSTNWRAIGSDGTWHADTKTEEDCITAALKATKP
jgi:hypothetical protein